MRWLAQYPGYHELQAITVDGVPLAEDQFRTLMSLVVELEIEGVSILRCDDRDGVFVVELMAFLARKVGEAHGAIFYPERVEGISATQVRVRGRLHRSVEAAREQNSTNYIAPVKMVWAFGPAFLFQIQRATIGPWQQDVAR